MRAVQIIRFGGPEALDVIELPDPEPGAGEKRHRRGDMAAVHREVHDDVIVLSHHAMDGCRRVVQIAVEGRERGSQTFATLRPCRVLDEVLRDQIEG